MKIACVLNSSEVDSETDLIIFPEGVLESEIVKVTNKYRDSIVVGAIRECPHMRAHMRAHIQHKGSNHTDYIKVGTDDRTFGSGNHPFKGANHLI